MTEDKKSESDSSEDNSELACSSEEISKRKIISHLRENPSFKDLSEEQLAIMAECCVTTSFEEYFQSTFSGPLPHPTILEGYENIYPGAANRIIEMAEANAENRISINSLIVEGDIKRSNRGQVLGFILSIGFIGASIFCAYLKEPFPASILGVGGFSSIISIFVLGRK